MQVKHGSTKSSSYKSWNSFIQNMAKEKFDTFKSIKRGQSTIFVTDVNIIIQRRLDQHCVHYIQNQFQITINASSTITT
jgi:hypothetical protein